MKLFYLSFLIFLNTVILYSQSSDVDLIIATFDTYKTAIFNNDGITVVGLVDSATISYYDSILIKIIFCDSASVDSLPFVDKVLVLMIRFSCSKSEILLFDGKNLLIYLVNNGLGIRGGVFDFRISSIIDFKGKLAEAKLFEPGGDSDLNICFNEENSVWKINLTSLYQSLVPFFNQVIIDEDHTTNDFFNLTLKALQQKLGFTAKNDVWKPLE